MKARIWDYEDYKWKDKTPARNNDHLRRAAAVNKNASLITMSQLHGNDCYCDTCWFDRQPKAKKAKPKPKIDLSTKRRKIKL